MMTRPPRITRLAPSPTGALHLGNARSFLINWALGRRAGWQVRMRIEDLDGPRIKTGAADEALDILQWLGIDHDGEVLYQAHHLAPYRTAMRTLSEAGLVFSCDLTRREIEAAAGAPHADEHDIRYDPSLRPTDPARFRFDEEETNYRLRVPDEPIAIVDEVMGAHTFRLAETVGDFVVWTRRGAPAYQLAVVVDDVRQGVTDVVRGDDLLESAARQALIYEALGHPAPRWWHLPLVLGTDGRRLAKRHGDTRLRTYREAGVTPERVIGLLASWSGVIDAPEPMSAADFRDGFETPRLPRRPVVFTPEHHAWLLDSSPS